MSKRILVVNPNSNRNVTAGIDAAVEPFRIAGGPAVECETLAEGPPGIETQAHVESVVLPLSRLVAKRDNDCDAFVVACFSDPGLYAAREATKKPVLGIAECGLLTALTLGERFGIVAILPRSIPRHQRYVGARGLEARFAGDRAIGLTVAELSDDARTLARMIEVGKDLKERDGADVIVMGCAGMARYRDRLQDSVGIPVVEPTQAAVGMALARVQLGW
ncbi:MAG: aspartate/glutamate racemase family protein [Rhodospirillales bacterium]|jgi:allantoin racemase